MHDPVLTAGTTPAEGRGSSDLAKLAISVIVATILAAQILIGFSYRGGQTFPIVAYPMYMQAHYEGGRLNDYVVHVSVDGGEGKAVGPEAMEISPWLYQRSITAPIIKGKPSPLAAEMARNACASADARTIAIAVYDSGYTIRREGPVHDGSKLMGTATFDCGAF
jgi:hypothetical protein